MAFQILSLSGGGFLGLYTATVLSELEKHARRPIASCFDLIAGTSIGGIIALALAAEKPANFIKSKFEENGTKIFSRRPAPQSTEAELVDFSRSVLSSKYDGIGLGKTLNEIFGGLLIRDLLHPALVPTVNLTKGQPQIFKTPHHPSFKTDLKLKLADVAMATSAAPTYFPIAEIGDELFADGGLYANSPDFLALHEAEYFFNIPTSEVRILSIGTTTTRFSFSHVGRRNLGVFGWGRKLPQVMISAQQLDVEYILGHKLGDRYIRIDEVQSKEQERDLGLDVATVEAQKTIRGLAAASVQKNISKPALETMLNYKAPSPKFYNLESK